MRHLQLNKHNVPQRHFSRLADSEIVRKKVPVLFMNFLMIKERW